MRYTFIIIVAATLLTACHRKPRVPDIAPETQTNAPTFATLGATKGEILAQLEQMKFRIITNTADIIVAEVGPEGVISGDGKPVTNALRSEYDFKDGKLTQSKILP